MVPLLSVVHYGTGPTNIPHFEQNLSKIKCRELLGITMERINYLFLLIVPRLLSVIELCPQRLPQEFPREYNRKFRRLFNTRSIVAEV